jgi:hypothetical protein
MFPGEHSTGVESKPQPLLTRLSRFCGLFSGGHIDHPAENMAEPALWHPAPHGLT